MPSTATADFEAERPQLLAVAYRMLGSRAEAEDTAQEAWLRYAKVRDGGEIRDLRGWLTAVTGRICLDVLKSARVSRAAYPGQWLPSYVRRTVRGRGRRPRHHRDRGAPARLPGPPRGQRGLVLNPEKLLVSDLL